MPTKLSNLGQEKNEVVYCELMALIKSSIVTFIKGSFIYAFYYLRRREGNVSGFCF